MRSGTDTIIPFTMKTVWLKFNPLHFFIRYLDFGRVFPSIEFSFHSETVASRCFANQLHDNLMADQGSPSPIHADMRKKPMFYFVPFAGPGREMADRNTQTGFCRKSLQLHLPQTDAVSVASSSVRTNQQLLSLWVNLLAHAQPPTPDTGHRKTRRI